MAWLLTAACAAATAAAAAALGLPPDTPAVAAVAVLEGIVVALPVWNIGQGAPPTTMTSEDEAECGGDKAEAVAAAVTH